MQVKIEESVRLQTVLVLYDEEAVRDTGQPSNQRLKASVRLHVDQTMRNRNFRARSETVDRGASAYVERKVGECLQWQRNRQCARGDSCSFTHDSVSGNTYESHRRKDQSSSPAPDTEGKTDGQKQLKRSGSRGQSLSRGKGRFLRLKKLRWPVM